MVFYFCPENLINSDSGEGLAGRISAHLVTKQQLEAAGDSLRADLLEQQEQLLEQQLASSVQSVKAEVLAQLAQHRQHQVRYLFY
jgi:hypothetical protein